MLLNAKDVTREAITLEPNKTLHDSRNSLLRYSISRVVVAKDNKPLGIITEKDIARFLYKVPNRRLSEIRLDEIMSKNLVLAREEDDLKACAKLMLDNKISSIIVVDNDKGDLKGIFTKSDLVEAYARLYSKKSMVDEYMTKKVITVAPDENLHMILLLMADNELSRIVVTGNRKPIGIITGHDLLPLSVLFGTGRAGGYWSTKEELVSRRRNIPSGIKSVLLAEDIMKYDPITIARNSDLAQGAQMMTRNRISGLPVVLENSYDAGNLVGIITRTDIIKALASAFN
ncbi:MAG TPA: CBS domain-containing protein [Candidatus Nitrosopolaris sp.]|nr:CBS domain-containing protein [Candidatus Nitrosopolaris sp.]